MVNFLALLGWSPGTDEELFTRGELIQRFTLEGISGGNAVFNPEKLDWFNQQHLLRLPTDELARRLAPSLKALGLWHDAFESERREWFHRVVDLYKPRIKQLDQFGTEARPLLADDVAYDPEAVRKHLSKPELKQPLEELAASFNEAAPFAAPELEQRLRRVAETHSLKAAALIHATRVAVTGRAASPGLFEVLELIGRERVAERMRAIEPFLLAGAVSDTPDRGSESAVKPLV
jgi:glutamyl-tRNA synthetase